MMLFEKVSLGDVDGDRMLEWGLGCEVKSLDLASVAECSNPANEAPEVLFGLESCEQSN